MKTDAEVRDWLRHEEQVPLEGWDFSYIAERVKEDPLPWSYTAIVQDALAGAKSFLDLGTGGGERLASLVPLPSDTPATEGYPPNIPVARARLEPLGVRVHVINDWRSLPFPDRRFDLVIDRHEAYEPSEVYRVLRPGGKFITQQVGATNNLDLNRLLGSPGPDRMTMPENVTLGQYRQGLEAEGFDILMAMEAFPLTRFFDAGAIVFWLKAIPWQIPDFSVDRYFERLKEVQRQIEETGPVTVRSHRFLLAAHKPG